MTDSTQLYERLLVLRCQTGDEAAFVEIVRNYSPRLHYFLHRLVGARADSEDLLQEIWASAFRALPRLRDPAAFPAWIYRIARDRAAREWRRNRPPEQPLVEEDGECSASDDFPAEAAERVHAALEALAPEQPEVLVLKFLEEMSYEQIATVTGCQLGTVRSRLHYGKRALRRILESQPPHERKQS